MSYTPYTPTTPTATTGQPQQQPVATPAYSYAYSAYTHPTTPGAYPYPYQAGATAYGWTYPYSYVPQHTPTAIQAGTATAATTPTVATPTVPRPTVMAPPVTPHTPTPVSLPQRTATFSAYTPTYTRDTLGSTTGRGGGRRQSNLKGLFAKELKSLMYGFGDDRNPSNDSVSVMEEILIEYIADICQTAAGPTRKSRISIDDLRRALSRPADAKKLARMEELLFMQEDIKRARAQFDEAEITTTKGL